MHDQPHAVSVNVKGEIKIAAGKLCGAKTRSGRPCPTPAMPNGRCRMHGGKSTGAPRGEKNGNWRGGQWTQAAQAERTRQRALLVELREIVFGGHLEEKYATSTAGLSAEKYTSMLITPAQVRIGAPVSSDTVGGAPT